MSTHRKSARLFTYWLTFVALAIFGPQFFPPPPGVDLAPVAGMVFLFFALAALVVALVAFVHAMKTRAEASNRAIAMGLSPLVVTLAFFTWALVVVAL